MSLVITGATGHLGRLAVEALLRRGTPASEIVATGRSTERLADLAQRGVVVRRADFDDPSTLAQAFAGGSTLLLVSTDAVGQRFDNHRRAIDAAREAGVGTIVYTSAPAADRAAMRLAQEHRLTEEHLRASGGDIVVLRNGWYWENYTDQLPALLAHHALIGSAGHGQVNPATRADYAEAAAAVMTATGHAGKTYELGGDTAYTLTELAAAMSTVLGEQIAYADMTEADHAAALKGAGLPDVLAEVLADADQGLARGELLVPGHDLRDLIARPTTTLEQALAHAPR